MQVDGGVRTGRSKLLVLWVRRIRDGRGARGGVPTLALAQVWERAAEPFARHGPGLGPIPGPGPRPEPRHRMVTIREWIGVDLDYEAKLMEEEEEEGNRMQ